MNNNNLYNNNTFIGTTHQDYFKISSNALSTQINITSNILEQHLNNTSNILNTNFNTTIDYTSNILEQHLNSTSNILDIRASNFTTTTSNLILARYDPLINEKNENILLPIPTTLKHTYIMNSNILGEIRFWCKDTQLFPVAEPLGVPDYRVKIDVDGKLKVYYTYDPLINLTFFNGWIDVANSIVGLNASEANLGVAIGTVELTLGLKITQLEVKVNQVVLGLQAALPRSQAITNMTNEIGIQLAENNAAVVSWSTFRNSLTNFFSTAQLQYLNQALTVVSYRIATNPVILSFLGIGGIAFAWFVSGAQNLSYIQVFNSLIEQKIENAYTSNYITSNRRAELLASNNELIVDNYIQYCSNIYNGSIAQGFINTNITTQQYLSNLKCDNLYLNNGNISGINYVNVNNIVADGRIKENNKFLDTTYLTSNHIYNLAYNYTAERQYPSKAFTTSSTEETVSLLSKLVYRQILFLDTNSITHGSGFYEIYSSSTFDNGITNKDKLFNFNTNETTTSPRWAISLYNSGTGNYQGDNSIDGSYYGDWVIIKMPQSILLTRYRIYQRSDFLTKAPAEWKVYGSNDGITFTEITEASQMTRLSSYTSGFYEKTLASTFTTQYQYFGFTFGKLLSTSGQTDLSFAELQLFGKEILNNSIVSNIYTTSNAVKSIVRLDMPDVGKRQGFVISIPTSSIFVDGTTSTTFYKYDLDLTKYTKTLNIPAPPNDPFRVFRIRCWYAPSYFGSYINGEPYVVSYEVYMSNKSVPVFGRPETAGINIYAVGFPENTKLSNILPNQIMVLKNFNSQFNYLTILSRTAPADLLVVIEDLLF